MDLLLLLEIAGLLLLAVLILVWSYRRAKKIPNAGYERVFGPFYVKDDAVYFTKGSNADKLKSIEVIGVIEVTRGTRLVQLEIRYRMDSKIKSQRIAGTTNELLTIADKLGYGR